VHSLSNTTPYNGGNCAGSVPTFSTTNNRLLVSGVLDGSTATGTMTGAFSSANPGGDYSTITITVQ
jgi:hypothetical protein